MARISESEIERLKREVSVQRLAEGRGIEPKSWRYTAAKLRRT